jgi:hypothetical protein
MLTCVEGREEPAVAATGGEQTVVEGGEEMAATWCSMWAMTSTSTSTWTASSIYGEETEDIAAARTTIERARVEVTEDNRVTKECSRYRRRRRGRPRATTMAAPLGCKVLCSSC